MRVIIAGGRMFQDYDFIWAWLDYLLQNVMDEIEVVEGGAPGADFAGRQWAQRNNVPYKTFNAKWLELGKKAGPIRNKEMAEYAAKDKGALILFWDGKSPGSASMLSLAKDYKLKIKQIIFTEGKLPPTK